jgi:CheY-like chemotaxis protein
MAKDGKLAVLVAENNPLERTLICSCLEGLGLFPDAAANGREAVEACRARAYDLIIMACRMPVLDGPAAAREIRAAEDGGGRRARIIGIAPGPGEWGPEMSIPPGMDAVIQSRSDEDGLRGQIAAMFRDRSGS